MDATIREQQIAPTLVHLCGPCEQVTSRFQTQTFCDLFAAPEIAVPDKNRCGNAVGCLGIDKIAEVLEAKSREVIGGLPRVRGADEKPHRRHVVAERLKGDRAAIETPSKVHCMPGLSTTLKQEVAGEGAVVVVGERVEAEPELLEVVDALDPTGPSLTAVEGRQQHSHQNNDERHDYEELD